MKIYPATIWIKEEIVMERTFASQVLVASIMLSSWFLHAHAATEIWPLEIPAELGVRSALEMYAKLEVRFHQGL